LYNKENHWFVNIYKPLRQMYVQFSNFNQTTLDIMNRKYRLDIVCNYGRH